MIFTSEPRADADAILERARSQFAAALDKIDSVTALAKPLHQGRVFDAALKLLKTPGGIEALRAEAARAERAGVFHGSDWATPQRLQPRLVRQSLFGPPRSVALEALSELRLLAIAEGDFEHRDVTAAQARAFLSETLALNLDLVFDRTTEATRAETPAVRRAAGDLMRFVAARLPTQEILESLIEEIEAILRQRPIMVDDVKAMIAQLAEARAGGSDLSGDWATRADALQTALFEPGPLSEGDPGLEAYRAALAAAPPGQVAAEARACTGAMLATGLVSDYHAALVGFVRREAPDMLSDALGLSEVGQQGWLCYRDLVEALADAAVTPATPQAVLGLHGLLERGALFHPPSAPGMWRLLKIQIAPSVRAGLEAVFGAHVGAESLVVAGVVDVLGAPLGVGQGDNPTCQSARAISLLAQVDPDYLLSLVVAAARDDDVVMDFEGQPISSKLLAPGLAPVLDPSLDPVSLLLTPHLDRIYAEMGRRAAGRGRDAHEWINPAFHGWWVRRGCRTVIDEVSQAVVGYEAFVREFFAAYHPFFNGGRPLIHPQPAGIAATNANGVHVGWHAISIQRVALDPDGDMRVYFHDPNNEGRQQWGRDVVTSTSGKGEIPGESSLPFEAFASRVYLFHFDPADLGTSADVPAESVARVEALARESWGADRVWV